MLTMFFVLSGIASIVSLFLAVKQMYPDYQGYISHTSAFLFGLTGGLLVKMVSAVSVTMPADLTAKELVGIALYVGTGLLAAIMMILSAFIDDAHRRAAAMQAAGGVSAFLVFLLIFFSSTFFTK